jgi:hypothetical protein
MKFQCFQFFMKLYLLKQLWLILLVKVIMFFYACLFGNHLLKKGGSTLFFLHFKVYLVLDNPTQFIG